MKSVFYKLILFTLVLTSLSVADRILQVGDSGVSFNDDDIENNKADWPQMANWKTAGVRGGIPFVEDQVIKITLKDGANSAAINTAITDVSKLGGGAILLENGTYDIDATITMKSNVSIIGESRLGVECIINTSMKNNAFNFVGGIENSGLYRFTIKGVWLNNDGNPYPKYNWNMSLDENNELDGNESISVFFKEVTDCWIDDMEIINSADFPVRVTATHITMRNLNVDGVYNKHGGCHGYFFLLQGYNLVTKCKITHLRHISIQGDGDSSVEHDGAEYNVFYDNDLSQEISFHNSDEGNNLIENNRITIPVDMPGVENPNYYAIMGPWASIHHISHYPNYVFKNEIKELNNGHNNATPWSNDEIIYWGPWEVKPSDPHTNFTKINPNTNDTLSLPIGGALYAIQINEESIDPEDSTITSTKISSTNINEVSIQFNPSINSINVDVDGNNKIILMNAKGSVVKELHNGENLINQLPASFYYVAIKKNNGLEFVQQFYKIK